MQCFNIPSSICHDIERACANLWWGDSINKKNLHWSRWKELCKSKSQGGVGFRDLASFNKALLAKQVWRVMQNEDSLVSRVLKAKYFPNSSILETHVGFNVSFIWRSMCSARATLQLGLRWKVGGGKKIRFYHDNFISDFKGGAIFPGAEKYSNVKVQNVTLPYKIWNEELINLGCGTPNANMIKEVPIMREGSDSFFWNLGPSKNYSVKSGYLAETGFFRPHENSSA